MRKDWKAEAAALFFTEGLSIVEISERISVSTASISKHLNSLPDYTTERERRKARNQNRTEYYRQYKRQSREAKNKALPSVGSRLNYHICAETIKREHEMAVRILSRDRY